MQISSTAPQATSRVFESAAREAAAAASGHARPTGGVRIYHQNPLWAGSSLGEVAEFARIAALGFTHVLMAPPFLPGAPGDLLLTADPAQIHPALGGGDALPALCKAVAAAEMHGLSIMLDLVVDRIAADAPFAIDNPDDVIHIAGGNSPPDPRYPPEERQTAHLRLDRPTIRARIAGLLRDWGTAGIVGYRGLQAHLTPAPVWRELIADACVDRPATIFVADIEGASPAQVAALAGSGFDFATSSSWAWDLRADWLSEDTLRAQLVGDILAMPERPSGHRFGAELREPDRELAARRALVLAAGLGRAWLMPMGFEYGARAAMDPRLGKPADFAALRAQPDMDLTEAVLEANRQHACVAGCAPAIIVPTPGAAFALLIRAPVGGGDGAVLMLNRALDKPASLPAARIVLALGGAGKVPASAFQADGQLTIAPGGAFLLETVPADPIHGPTLGDHVPPPERRIDIDAITPLVDGGRYAVKRRIGEAVRVEANVIGDGHEIFGVALLVRAADRDAWLEVRMAPLGNDRFAADMELARLGRHVFAVEAWLDRFATFSDELRKKHNAGLVLTLELQEGAKLVQEEVAANQPALDDLGRAIASASGEELRMLLMAPETAARMAACDSRAFRTRSAEFPIDAERSQAGFASWYELFPRSQTDSPERHGTFRDVIARLPAVRDMGFDVLYFPPIHPIGRTHRKGRNNSLQAGPDDPGSPYAIGSEDGGHDAIHPELGTMADFRALRDAAAEHGLELALDFAIQCSPDHPWLREHPEWFDWRPDGTIRYAENPPKKYEDIVNVDFYAPGARPSLWIALRDVVLFWVREGVRTFRVDNPHTKPFPFWEWLIADIRSEYPDVLFLAEAFTRPTVMYRLAKVGFSQSYTYFTWRNAAWEFRDYLRELADEAPREFFRPNFFVNTPDINPVFLHNSGRPGFLIRACLASTLSGLWGLYSGFELCESAPIAGGKEEYLDSEKYEIRVRDWNQPGNIIAEITRLNMIRRANPALQTHLGVRFLPSSNENVLCYVKATVDNMIIVAVSMQPSFTQTSWIHLTPDIWAFAAASSLHLENLMEPAVSEWFGDDHEVTLDQAMPFAIWRVRPASEG